jgi:hypothetical protein
VVAPGAAVRVDAADAAELAELLQFLTGCLARDPGRLGVPWKSLLATAHKLGLIQADHAVALSLSMTHKAVGFDRPMPEPDFDYLDLPPTGSQPVGIPGATRRSGARNRQAPRGPSVAPSPDSIPTGHRKRA